MERSQGARRTKASRKDHLWLIVNLLGRPLSAYYLSYDSAPSPKGESGSICLLWGHSTLVKVANKRSAYVSMSLTRASAMLCSYDMQGFCVRDLSVNKIERGTPGGK